MVVRRVRRMAVLFAVAGCNEPAAPQPAPRSWLYPPALAAWPLGPVTGSIGRSQAPDVVLAEGIEAPAGAGALVPLHSPTPWVVPGKGPAHAVVYGLVGTTHAIELIDIDAGRLLWRDTTACGAPIVGVTEQAVVCADAKGIRGIALTDGKPKWKSDGAFIGMTDDRVIAAGPGESVILDAAVGDELAHIKLPPGVTSDSILASCGDAGRELFAYGQDSRLVHIVEGPGGPKIAWGVTSPTITSIDACDGDHVIVTTTSGGTTSLISLARATGAVTGTIADVHGWWPARDGTPRIEVSTVAGVMLHSRDLAGPTEAVGLPVLGELLAKRNDQRLLRATPLSAVVLDAHGVRAYLPFAQLGAVLGDSAILAGSWNGSPGETVRRIPIPAQRYARQLRVPLIGAGAAVPAELRDLPELTALDASSAVAKLDTGKAAVAAVALDPVDAAAAVYATALEHEPDDATSAGVARFDLKTRAWSWYRSDGCGPGTPVALAVSRVLVACAARNATVATVHATTRDGQPMWTWQGANVDGVEALGDLVLVRDAGRAYLLDGKDGRVLGSFASDDGSALPAALLDVQLPDAAEPMAMLVTAERGRVMGRLPRAQLVPAWSLEVHGVVRSIAASGDGVLVDLEDGDAYRIDARTGAATSMPGIGGVWRATEELVTAEVPGGPIPPATMPVTAAAPAAKKAPPKAPKKAAPKGESDDDSMNNPPTLPTTWPAPPPMAASWQYTLYDLGGGLRARNDYALSPPITPAAARSPTAPLVVQSGAGLHDILVVEPHHGDPLRRVHLPDDAAPGTAFSTVVDGKPVVGTLLANPLRVLLF